jgi:phosphocarrier protein HPr
MQLLMMAAGQGSALVLHIDGEDEAAATEDLVALFDDGFGEPCG